MKDYATKALISSVDHLGSVAFKVTTFLDDKVTEFSDTKVRFSNIEQVLDYGSDLSIVSVLLFVQNEFLFLFTLRLKNLQLTDIGLHFRG